MWLWSISLFFLFCSAFELFRIVVQYVPTQKTNLLLLQKIQNLSHELQGILESGMIPDPQYWNKLNEITGPWGLLIKCSLFELRESGSSILPTVKRFSALAQYLKETISLASSKAAQSLAQAGVCMMLVPVLGLSLYYLLPALSTHLLQWCITCSIAFVFCILASLWIAKLTDQASWGGLKKSQRDWFFLSHITGERLLAFIRSGTPP